VDAGATDANLKRLRRIEGHVRGLQKMVEEGRYRRPHADRVGPRGAARRGTRVHAHAQPPEARATCAIREGGDRANEMYDELLDLM
jgi:hypothetical protein